MGRGGRLFDQLMAEKGYDTNRDLLIANIVKCRPPENRAPRRAEARACLPYLVRQMALVKPGIVVLLGATALKFLLPSRRRETMRDIVGCPFTDSAFPGVAFVVFYHPAFLLRDPRKLADARAHIVALKGLEEETCGPSGS